MREWARPFRSAALCALALWAVSGLAPALAGPPDGPPTGLPAESWRSILHQIAADRLEARRPSSGGAPSAWSRTNDPQSVGARFTAGAEDPVVVDSLIGNQVKKLTASDAAAADQFGFDVSISGDTAAVGAPFEDGGGAVYLFERNAGGADNWGQVRKVTASDAAVGDGFGRVALSGDTLVVGAPGDDSAAGVDAGSAYVFERNSGGADAWGQVRKLVASDAAAGDLFGSDVSISRDTVVVGAPGGDDAGADSGSAYVFVRNSGGADNWGQVAKLVASDGAAADESGSAVSISGDVAVVGAPLHNGAETDSGAAYVFARNAGGADQWAEVRKLAAGDGSADDRFGIDVAINGDNVVVGASQDDDAGSAYIFARNAGGADQWGEVQKLVATDAAEADAFGQSVAIDDDRILVGARGSDDAGSEAGAAYVFERNAGGPDEWGEILKLVAADAGAEDHFGHSVSISGDTLIAGAPDSDDAGSNSGASYVFTAAGCSWKEFAKVAAADAAAGDEAGFSVAVSGDFAVVGAHFDDGPGSNSGAAYVFERNAGGGDDWGQIRKLTAPTPVAGDEFGISVGISGDTVVVGAIGDDLGALSSGAAYVFSRNAGGADNWGFVKKLKAADPGTSDELGVSVAISGDTVVVGSGLDNAPGSDSGSAYVFERNAGGADDWGQVKKLVPADPAAGDRFGNSVAISGDTIAVGSSLDDDGGSNSGSAYVFGRNAGGADNWGQVRKLLASDDAAGDQFGSSVSIDGDTVVVGSNFDDDQGSSSGSAYVFERNAGGADLWGQVRKLTPSDGAALDNFGRAVSISVDKIVVGSLDDDGGTDSGAIYVFERNTGGADSWGQVQKLVASDAAALDNLGRAVSISGETLVTGAHANDDAGSASGAAYVFRFNCSACGDGIEERPEDCDDGAGNSDVVPDACRTDCTLPACGDDVADTGEDCDDAGESRLCDPDCTFADCGDGTLNESAGEDCDDEGESASCDVDCSPVECGDGTPNPSAGEQCDDAVQSVRCDEDCTFAECGDGTLNAPSGERCDDGNTLDGDGCSGECSDGCSWNVLATPQAEDAAATDRFGRALSISGDTLAVGVQFDDDAGSQSGSVYLFERHEGGPNDWDQFQKLVAPDGEANANFGVSVSISGDTLVVGAYTDDGVAAGSGSAYVFERDGTGSWALVKKLTALGGAEDDQFGVSVAVNGDTVVVGAHFDSDAGSLSGSAFVFGRHAGGVNNWGQVKKLVAADAAAFDQFGESVSISGNTIVVGAFNDNTPIAGAGSAYVFERHAGGSENWGQVKKLTATGAAVGDAFGWSVSIAGDRIVVGSFQDDAGVDSGSAHVFERNAGGPGNWGHVKKLVAADASAGDSFGHSVAISGERILVGSYHDAVGFTDSGSAYVFERDAGGGGNWGQVAKLTAPDASSFDQFGFAAALDGSTVAIGSHQDDDGGNDSGSAYVFQRHCSEAPGEASPAGDLRASQNGTAIDVDFAPACGATDHTAYWGVGPIAGALDWIGSACGLGIVGTASFDPGVTLLPGEWLYFVVAGYDDSAEGSYGSDSSSAQRPEASGVGACDRPLLPSMCE